MMEKLKTIGLKILFPHIAVVALVVPLATAMLIYAFAYSGAHPAVQYASYFLSAYALTITCARLPRMIETVKTIRQENPYILRYRQDVSLRIKISLASSLGMNLLYAFMQLVLGIINHSVWFYALAMYYILLSVMRYFLLKEALENRLGKNRYFEYLIYRLCGILLGLMNIALSIIVFYIVQQNRGFEHHYIVTIAMAAYTFFTFTMAIVNIIKYRRYKSPVMSASKAISFAAALVSMLSLETAMLTAFSEGDDPALRQTMTAYTGAAVCIIVLAIAVYMIVSSTKEIKTLKGETNNGTRTPE